MADPICRWRNPYVNTIIELVRALPHEEMPSAKFRAIIEERWPGFLHTPYQLACQIGLYYESEDGVYYPRFDHDINDKEALSYMRKWVSRYYVPNPYTRSMKTLQQPQLFLASIIGYVIEHPDEIELHSILEAVFQEKIGNIDIISNVLNTYTDLIRVDAIGNIELTDKAIDFMKQYIDRNDKKAFFDNFSESNNAADNISKNLIFYGAPGTGKSHEVKKQTGELLDNGEEQDLPNVYRTTFHPDTDYASFVGCYKPSMESKEPIYTPAQLIDKLSIIKNSGASYPCQKFGAMYWESLKELSANEIKQILTACGFTDSMSVEVPKGIAVGEEFASLNGNKQIVYRFVPQTFTEAYIYAYTHSTEQTYLVIEEINRGNCAQIFGDLFQLLDRKGGVSEYKIKADKDLANYLVDILGEDSEGIKEGKLCLPANLNILATMNTSDQSLFPMDSAFKRRWEWEYIPINYGSDTKSGTFEITIGDKTYPWVGFIKEVNKRIFDLTQSEDKQLGDFFIKHSVDEKEFKSKVMFYLWYEVLRDETENNKYFFYKKTIVDDKEENGKFIFKDLYDEDATQILQQFMEYLGVAPK